MAVIRPSRGSLSKSATSREIRPLNKSAVVVFGNSDQLNEDCIADNDNATRPAPGFIVIFDNTMNCVANSGFDALAYKMDQVCDSFEGNWLFGFECGNHA